MGCELASTSYVSASLPLDTANQPVCARRNFSHILSCFPATAGHPTMALGGAVAARTCDFAVEGYCLLRRHSSSASCGCSSLDSPDRFCTNHCLPCCRHHHSHRRLPA